MELTNKKIRLIITKKRFIALCGILFLVYLIFIINFKQPQIYEISGDFALERQYCENTHEYITLKVYLSRYRNIFTDNRYEIVIGVDGTFKQGIPLPLPLIKVTEDLLQYPFPIYSHSYLSVGQFLHHYRTMDGTRERIVFENNKLAFQTMDSLFLRHYEGIEYALFLNVNLTNSSESTLILFEHQRGNNIIATSVYSGIIDVRRIRRSQVPEF